MKYLIINLSPRIKGTSSMLTNYFAEKLAASGGSVKALRLFAHLKEAGPLLDAIRVSDSIIMIGPCYVDTYPADTIWLLQKMSQAAGVLHGQSLYGFIQGGMPYAHTHENGLWLLDNFADENKAVWKGGFVMGGGAVLNGQPLNKVIGAKKMIPAIDTFIKHILADEVSPAELYQKAEVKMPVVITFMLSGMMNLRIRKIVKAITD